ncbi:potassium channel family protein [Catenisphaera adipataccumulans]|jgi:voltage-gated potassium channel|uniref:Voltage-gated potassium channel n=1 Tax=Catenisphaera adipataccumulans TaxID=700500 RepID=A0A7W8FXN9_9FIRM|nr:potassium channel family protein [Catenisphaera adipataccumulans]MBB5183157.1 voltage-gated potassium channel [Catenisphaera adipataccumulans]
MSRKRRRHRQKRRRLLMRAFRSAGVVPVFEIYLVYFIVAAIIIQWAEPSIHHITDSLWYCFAVATTSGFGDYTAVTAVGRIVSVLLSVYSIAVTAIFTAVIASYFMDLFKLDASESSNALMDDLENLPELSKEELAELSQRVKKFREQ